MLTKDYVCGTQVDSSGNARNILGATPARFYRRFTRSNRP